MEQTAAGSTDQSEVLVGSRQCGDRHHCYLYYKSCDCSPLLRSLSSVHTYAVLTFLPSCYSLSFPVSAFAHSILCLLLSFALDTLAAMIKTQVPACVTSVHYVTSQQHYTDSCNWRGHTWSDCSHRYACIAGEGATHDVQRVVSQQLFDDSTVCLAVQLPPASQAGDALSRPVSSKSASQGKQLLRAHDLPIYRSCCSMIGHMYHDCSSR